MKPLWSFDFSYQHRKTGPSHVVLRESGALPVALARATRAFYAERTTKERYDIKNAGVKVQIVFIRNEQSATERGCALRGERRNSVEQE
jgi:hypothetical protein